MFQVSQQKVDSTAVEKYSTIHRHLSVRKNGILRGGIGEIIYPSGLRMRRFMRHVVHEGSLTTHINPARKCRLGAVLTNRLNNAVVYGYDSAANVRFLWVVPLRGAIKTQFNS